MCSAFTSCPADMSPLLEERLWEHTPIWGDNGALAWLVSSGPRLGGQAHLGLNPKSAGQLASLSLFPNMEGGGVAGLLGA